MWSCQPEDWLPFGDPLVEVDPLALEIQQRLEQDQSVLASASPLLEIEKSIPTIKHFLKNQSNNKESAYEELVEWIKWRRELQVNEITEDLIANELSTREAFWHGKDKKNQPCLIVTGRLHDTSLTVGSGKSFKQFIIYLVEHGFKITQQENAESDKVCFLYDRRGLEYDHIDTFLYQSCTKLLSDLQRWYSSKLGTIYILHLNSWFWILYQVILRPLFGLLALDKIIVLTSPAELLEYFDEDQLPPNFLEKGVSKLGNSSDDNIIEEVRDLEIKRDV